jgi:hypothetical protein
MQAGEILDYELGGNKVEASRLSDTFEMAINDLVRVKFMANPHLSWPDGVAEAFCRLNLFACSSIINEVFIAGRRASEDEAAEALIKLKGVPCVAEYNIRFFKNYLLANRLALMVVGDCLNRKLPTGTALRITWDKAAFRLETAGGLLLRIRWPAAVSFYGLAEAITLQGENGQNMMRNMIRDCRPEAFVTVKGRRVRYIPQDGEDYLKLAECFIRDENPFVVALLGHYNPPTAQ